MEYAKFQLVKTEWDVITDCYLSSPKKPYLRIVLSILIFISFNYLKAQEPNPNIKGGEIEDTQIIIEKDKPLTLPKAERIFKKSQVKSLSEEKVDLDYQITQPGRQFGQYVPSFTFPHLDVKGERHETISYIKAGYGNYNSPLLEVLYGYGQDALTGNVWLRHESFAKGPVRGKESAYGNTQVRLSGKYEVNKVGISPEISFSKEGYYLYGYNPEFTDSAFTYKDRKISSTDFALKLPVDAKINEDFNISLVSQYQYSQMRFKGDGPFNKEHLLGLDGKVHYDLNQAVQFGLTSKLLGLTYQSGFDQNRLIWGLGPYVKYNEDRWNLRGGLKLYTAKQTFLFPDVAARYQMAHGLGIFANVSGGLGPVSLYGVKRINTFLEDSLDLRNEQIMLDFLGGMELSLSEKLMVRPYVGFKQTKNKLMFFNSLSDTSRFDLIYDTGKFKQFSIGGNLIYVARDKASFDVGVRYTLYDPENVVKAWYLPSFQVQLMGYYEVVENLVLSAKIEALAGIQAPDLQTQEPQSMPVIVDVGASGKYTITQSIGVFIDFSNIFGENYERFLNYPVRGLSMKAGFIFRF